MTVEYGIITLGSTNTTGMTLLEVLEFIFGTKLYMFWTVPLSIIKSFFTVHTAVVYVILKFHKWVKLLVYIRVHCICIVFRSVFVF